ncbi:MAG: hypothetical protein AAGE52_09520 [Myxococcota bacterium]
MDYEAFEAMTSDSPGDPRWPAYTRAPTDADAAAPDDPFVHLITPRGTPSEVLVRFWFDEKANGPVLRVDAEPLVDDYNGTPASLKATSQLIAVAFFYYFANGHYQQQGVQKLDVRDIRTGERLVGPHP